LLAILLLFPLVGRVCLCLLLLRWLRLVHGVGLQLRQAGQRPTQPVHCRALVLVSHWLQHK
jgi:hypothetical protein